MILLPPTAVLQRSLLTRPYLAKSFFALRAIRERYRFSMISPSNALHLPTTMTTAGEIPPFLANQSSTTSLRSGRLTATVPSTNSRSSSTSSIPFADGEVDVVTEEGLRHSPIKLEAR